MSKGGPGDGEGPWPPPGSASNYFWGAGGGAEKGFLRGLRRRQRRGGVRGGQAMLLVEQGVLCVLPMLWLVLLLSEAGAVVETGCSLEMGRVCE